MKQTGQAAHELLKTLARNLFARMPAIGALKEIGLTPLGIGKPDFPYSKSANSPLSLASLKQKFEAENNPAPLAQIHAAVIEEAHKASISSASAALTWLTSDPDSLFSCRVYQVLAAGLLDLDTPENRKELAALPNGLAVKQPFN